MFTRGVTRTSLRQIPRRRAGAGQYFPIEIVLPQVVDGAVGIAADAAATASSRCMLLLAPPPRGLHYWVRNVGRSTLSRPAS